MAERTYCVERQPFKEGPSEDYLYNVVEDVPSEFFERAAFKGLTFDLADGLCDYMNLVEERLHKLEKEYK